VSSDYLRTSTQFKDTVALFEKLTMVSEAINTILWTIDIDQYNAMAQLRHKMAIHPHVRALQGIDKCLYLGRRIIFNGATMEHVDRNEYAHGWTPLVCLGACLGRLVVRRIGAIVSYNHGDIIFLRGAILPHEVEVSEGTGMRVTLAHFAHERVFHEFLVVLPL
jgi:hypothetical protein